MTSLKGKKGVFCMTETESRLRYKKTFSRLGWLYAGLMLGVQALGAAVAVLGVLVWPQLAETGWFSWVVSYVPLYGVCAPLFFLLLKKAVPAQPAAREKNAPSAGRMAAPVFADAGARCTRSTSSRS